MNKNKEYISKNGALYKNINSLDNKYTPYKTKIREKVKYQFGKEDVPGIIFHENSTVANAISQSQELKDFVSKNISILKSGKEISGSLGFNSNSNLKNTVPFPKSCLCQLQVCSEFWQADVRWE